VTRVLHPGGHFLYADLRGGDAAIAEWEAMLADSPLRLLSQEDIGAQVARAGAEFALLSGPGQSPCASASAPLVPRSQRREGHATLRRCGNRDVSYRLYCLAKDVA
jgi:hypothetical protein